MKINAILICSDCDNNLKMTHYTLLIRCVILSFFAKMIRVFLLNTWAANWTGLNRKNHSKKTYITFVIKFGLIIVFPSIVESFSQSAHKVDLISMYDNWDLLKLWKSPKRNISNFIDQMRAHLCRWLKNKIY